MTERRSIRGVLFDLDGTLYSSTRRLKVRVAFRLWTDLSILRHVGGAREWVRAREFDGQKALREAYHAELGRRSGLDARMASRWFEHRFLTTFIEVLERHSGPRDGLLSTLKSLRQREIALAVLSDYGRVAERLEALRIPVTLFDELMSAEESGALKPSARPFLMASERLDLPPETILVVGDREDMDGVGARAAGMPFIGVGSPDRGPDFRSWPGVVDHLMSL